MPSRGIRIPCAGRSTVWRRFARTSIRGTPLRDEAQRPNRSHLPRSRNPTIALTVDALAAARHGRNDVLGIVPSTRFSWIRFCASLRACSPATRRAHAAEIVVWPQTHLHHFHDDAEIPRPAARDPFLPPIDVSPGTSLVTLTSPYSGIPTVQLKARLPPRTSAARTLASLTVTLPYAPPTPSTALGSMQTHRFVCRSQTF
ncbi:hypothetical protein B0H14DRAFT_3027634 [Mycena olivaceomarginata]|nr:hypothetical protein B0H14DRAFT_3027634 [Mycena olivaceomarginata]